MKLVRKWKKQLHDSPSLKLLRNIISAFKVAVNLNKEENIEDYKYAITDEKAFHELMFMVLKDVPQAIQKMAPYKIVKAQGPYQMEVTSPGSRPLSSRMLALC